MRRQFRVFKKFYRIYLEVFLKFLLFKFLKTFRLKVGYINAWAVGHLIWEMDLARITNSINKRIIWFYTNNFIPNKYIFNLMTAGYYVPNRLINKLIGKFFVNLTRYSIYDANVPAKQSTSNIQDFAKISVSIENISDFKLLQRSIQKIAFELKKPYICLTIRDGSYDLISNGKNSVDLGTTYRNCNVNSHHALIKEFIENHFQVVLMGDTKEITNFQDKNFFNYSKSPIKNGEIDVLLYFHCNFAVSNCTGIDELASLFRKKVFLFDDPRFLDARLTRLRPLILPKTYKYIDSNKLVDLEDLFETGVGLTRSDRFLLQNNIKVECNDDLIQTAFARECIRIQAGNAPILKLKSKTQNLFENQISKLTGNTDDLFIPRLFEQWPNSKLKPKIHKT